MHRVGYLFDNICDMDNLVLAVKNAIRGKRKRGDVQRFMANKDENLRKIQLQLISGTYNPRPYGIKTICDRGSGKTREIFIPKFYPDQIVQWAIMQVIQPVLQKAMYHYSCASIAGKGSILGIRKVKKIMATDYKNNKYGLALDIRKFYPSIDQDILMAKFRNKIKDERVIELISKIVRSTTSGLPIGNYTSQWFANFYLTDLDHYIKEKLNTKYYIRYMDDMVLMGGNKRKLHRAKDQISDFLAKEKLELKSNWQVFKVADDPGSGRGIDFLGFVFYRNCVKLRARTYLRSARRIRKIGRKGRLTAKDSCAVFSYLARYNLTTTAKLYNRNIREHVSMSQCRESISRETGGGMFQYNIVHTTWDSSVPCQGTPLRMTRRGTNMGFFGSVPRHSTLREGRMTHRGTYMGFFGAGRALTQNDTKYNNVSC